MKRKFIWLFFAVVALLATTNLALATSWSTAQGNNQRTGHNPSSVVDQTMLTQQWTYPHPTHAAIWSDPVEAEGLVFATFVSFTAAANLLEAIDINTGLMVWSMPLSSSGTAARGTPAVGVTLDGSGFPITVVYVASGSSGGAAGLQAFNALTGAPIFAPPGGGGTAAQRIRYTRPCLIDTDLDGFGDIVVVGTEAGDLFAFHAFTGALVWTVVLDPGYWVFFGPSASTDGKVVYCGTWDLLGTGHGRVHAVDAITGLHLPGGTNTTSGIFDPIADGAFADEGYPAAVVYIDDNTVAVHGYGANGTDGWYSILERDADLLGQGSINNRAVFSSGAVYPDPLSTDTIFIVPTEGAPIVFGVPIIARARNIPTMRGGGSGFKYNLFGCNLALPDAPITAANSPDGFGVAAINTDAPDQRLYIFPAKSATGTTNLFHWQKEYLFSAGFLNLSGSLWADGSSDSGIVFVTQEGWSMVHGFGQSARARWTDASGCLAPVLLNVPFAFNGTDTDTVRFYNIGSASGSIAAFAASAAASLGQNVSKIEFRPRATSSSREALADDMADYLTVTSKSQFMGKSVAPHSSVLLMDQFPALPDRSLYINKTRGTSSAAAAPEPWLTVNNLTGPGPYVPGDSADIELIASSAALNLGTYFGDLELTVAPDDPDPDFYGGTELVIPVTFIVGFVPEFAYIEASDAALQISNFGQFGPAGESNFYWNGWDPHQLYSGGLVVISSDMVWEATYDDDGEFLPDANILCDVTAPGSPYVAQVNVCSTAMITNGGSCSLRIQQYYIGLWDGAFCDSMIIQKNVFCNIGNTPCTLSVGYFMDWDFPPPDFASDTVAADPLHQLIWIENVNDPGLKIGVMRKPSDDVKALLVGVDNPTSIYGTPGPVVDDTLRKWWATPNGTADLSANLVGPDDKSLVAGVNGIIIQPGEYHLEEYIIWAWDDADVVFGKKVWKAWLRQEGFYRGDVNTDNRGEERDINNNPLGPAPAGGQINIIDVVFLANYLLKGSASPWPFTDQGDVNCDGVVDLADVIALANYVFKGTNVPVDKNRFLPLDYQALFSRSSIWQNADYR